MSSEIDPDVEERASENDRLWFAARPTRRYRWRTRMLGELSAPIEFAYVLVAQMFPGARVRQAVYWIGGALPPDSDEQLARLADRLAAGEPAAIVNGQVIGFKDLPVGGKQ